MMEKISDLIKLLEESKEKYGDIHIIGDTSWNPDVKSGIYCVIHYTANELEKEYNNPSKAKNNEEVLCLRLK